MAANPVNPDWAERVKSLSEKMEPVSSPSNGRPRRTTLADYEEEDPKYIFDDWHYIRDEQLNLWDAKGGTGKTSLILGVSALGANGLSPCGAAVEPFSTLYYGSEDSGGEMRKAYRLVGGKDPTRFIYVPDQIHFDNKGFKVLREDLAETGARIFVLDAAKYYLPGGNNAEFDTGIVAEFCGRLREVAREYKCACILMRHFRRNTQLTDLLDQGAGLAQWYNSCRSNLVLAPHPEKPGNAVAFHAKPSLLTKRLPPIGCGYSSMGDWGFWKPTAALLASMGYDEDGNKAKPNGRPPQKLEEAKQFLYDTLRDGGMRSKDVIELAAKAGIQRTTLYDAKKEMADFDDRRGYWMIDPYSD